MPPDPPDPADLSDAADPSDRADPLAHLEPTDSIEPTEPDPAAGRPGLAAPGGAGHGTADAAADRTVARRVGPEQTGMRVDVFLAAQPEVGSRSVAKALIHAGQVRVQDRACKPGHSLIGGQLVRFAPQWSEPVPPAAQGLDVPPRILHEDPYILVVAKPAGLLCHPAERASGSSVAQWAVALHPELPRVSGADRPGIVHRLDKETSGVMVVAKTEDAFHFLKGEFRARRVGKEYRAIAYGEARFDSDHIDRNIAAHPKKGDRMVVVPEGGREASTFYEVIERFRGFTHFACHPKTGRTHQIRVHMMSVGHGLVGDRFYRSRSHASARLPAAAPDPGRHCLHARRLTFTHPHSRETVTFETELPPDMAALLQWLAAHRAP